MSGYGNAYVNQAFSFKSLISVSSSASMPGGVRGIYANATASCLLVANDGNQAVFVIPTGVTIWVNAAYAATITVAATSDLIQLT